MLSGLAGVFTSVMIYHDTQRPFWALPFTALRFYGTAIGLGAVVSVFAAAGSQGAMLLLAGGVFAFKAAVEANQLLVSRNPEFSPAKKSALANVAASKALHRNEVSLLASGVLTA